MFALLLDAFTVGVAFGTGAAVVALALFGAGAVGFGAAFVFSAVFAGASFVCDWVATAGEGVAGLLVALLRTAGCAAGVASRLTLTFVGVAPFVAPVEFTAFVVFTFAAFVAVALFATSPMRAFGAGTKLLSSPGCGGSWTV